MKPTYVEFMKASKEHKTIFGIVGGLGLHLGIEPRSLRYILTVLAILMLILDITGFIIILLGYVSLYYLTPEYDSTMDLQVNPDANENDWI